jgi:pyrrolysine biosynthesis protein PylC
MKAVIVGGSLQGTEAVYLAHQAGWETVLIDRKPDPPASGLCHRFIQQEIASPAQLDRLIRTVKNVDIVIPATENSAALEVLVQWSASSDIPLTFDSDAYEISSSKIKSNRLFSRLGAPAPSPWPECGFPVAAKPDSSSGSRGVRVFRDQEEMKAHFSSSRLPEDWVLQEYVEGPSYSLEVVGTPGNYTALQVTDLEMDDLYDCKQVTAPTLLTSRQVDAFKQVSLDLAEALQLRGLMDVEVILHGNQLKLLEIDARLPSQTPTVVYLSTGCNMLQLLADCFLNPDTIRKPVLSSRQRGVVYRHIEVTPAGINECGEHIMAAAGPLRLYHDFFGADEALSNYEPNRTHWAATLITTANTLQEALIKSFAGVQGVVLPKEPPGRRRQK